jgi:hypothetical protein
MAPYRTKEELKYFGSDLNKFVFENCRKDMYVMNIDLVQYRKFKDKRILRFIESKHEHERTPKMQMTVLKTLGQAFNFLNRIVSSNLYFELYLVKSSPPYMNSFVTDLIGGDQISLTKGELIGFFDFTYQWPNKKKLLPMEDTD